MLAATYLSADTLRIAPRVRDALIEVLTRMERGELVHVYEPEEIRMPLPGNLFCMNEWNTQMTCGTVRCIGGWCEYIMDPNKQYDDDDEPDWITTDELEELFYPPRVVRRGAYQASVGQAAAALRNYLTTGEPNWEQAMSVVEVGTEEGTANSER